MVRQVIWTQQAKLEFRTIAAYWNKRNRNSSYSRKLRNLIRTSMRSVASHPHTGALTDEFEIRRKLVRDYFVFYRILEMQIEILSIWDTRRNPNNAPYSY